MTSQIKTVLLLALLSAIIIMLGGLMGGRTGIIFAFGLALVMNVGSYWYSDKIVLSMYRAREVAPEEAPYLHKIVEELSHNAGIPKPRICVVPEEAPNAFATGRNPENAAVAASTGLLNMLTEEEVAGVMAHELAHIQNRDTLTMTITATLAGAISMLGNFAFLFGGNRDNNNNNPLGGIGVLVAMIVAPFAAMLVQMAISRTREYSADRRGAEICGHPLWLASALGKIAGYAQQIPNDDAERNPATAHMFIINPLSGQKMDNLFSTHPDTGNRIAALQDMAGEFASQPAPRSTPAPAADRAVRKARSVPSAGWGRDNSNPPKGPWS